MKYRPCPLAASALARESTGICFWPGGAKGTPLARTRVTVPAAPPKAGPRRSSKPRPSSWSWRASELAAPGENSRGRIPAGDRAQDAVDCEDVVACGPLDCPFGGPSCRPPAPPGPGAGVPLAVSPAPASTEPVRLRSDWSTWPCSCERVPS